MKRLSLFLALFILSCTAFAQRTIQMRNIWTKPQVHVLFEGYTLSFTIKDINRALVLLAETGDTTFGLTSCLDPAQTYKLELFSGTRVQYQNTLQHLMQNGVGAFLLMAGHAYIENPKHKQMQQIIADIQEFPEGVNEVFIRFTDPKNSKRLFTGKMAVNMYNKDLGIE